MLKAKELFLAGLTIIGTFNLSSCGKSDVPTQDAAAATSSTADALKVAKNTDTARAEQKYIGILSQLKQNKLYSQLNFNPKNYIYELTDKGDNFLLIDTTGQQRITVNEVDNKITQIYWTKHDGDSLSLENLMNGEKANVDNVSQYIKKNGKIDDDMKNKLFSLTWNVVMDKSLVSQEQILSIGRGKSNSLFQVQGNFTSLTGCYNKQCGSEWDTYLNAGQNIIGQLFMSGTAVLIGLASEGTALVLLKIVVAQSVVSFFTNGFDSINHFQDYRQAYYDCIKKHCPPQAEVLSSSRPTQN